MKMKCVVWILLFLKLLGAAADFPVMKSCLPHALRLQRIQAFPVDNEITATAMIKGSKGFFLCTAKKPALKPQSTIACRSFPINSYGGATDQFDPVAKVEGEITDFKVLSRRQSSLVIAVIKNEPSRLFAVHPNGTSLSFTELGPIGSIGAHTIRMVQNRDRVAVITSSSRLCQNVGQDCNVPGVEVISSDNVVTRCVSPEFGASSATTGWPFGRYFYIVHALKNQENPRKMQLTLFRLDETADPTHCLLETLETLDIDIKPPLCDVHSLRLFRASGMYFLLISSHDCETPASEKTGSSRNILTLQWSPITGLLDEKSLAELKDTDRVREVTSLSASIFLLDRPNIYPSTIHCLTADILRSGNYDGVHKAELETVATLPPSLGASKFTAMNNNEGRIYVARITEDVKWGQIVEIDQLSCQDGDYPNRGDGATNKSSRNSASELRKVDPRQSQHALYGRNGNGAIAGKQVFTNWIGDFHDYEDSVPLLVPAPKTALRSASQTNNAPEAPVWQISRRLKFPEELESEESAYEEIPFAQYIAETSTFRSHEEEHEDYPKGISYVNDTVSFLELEAPNVAVAGNPLMHRSHNETSVYRGEEHDHEVNERISYGNDSIEFLDVEGQNPSLAGTYRNTLVNEAAASHYEEGDENERISYTNDTMDLLDAEGPSPAHLAPPSPRRQSLQAPPQVPHEHNIPYAQGQGIGDVLTAAGQWDYDHTDYEYDEHHKPGIRYNQTADFPDGQDSGYQPLNQTRKVPVIMPVNPSDQEHPHDHIHYDYDEGEASEPELRPPSDNYHHAPPFVQPPPVNFAIPQVPIATPAVTYAAHPEKGLHYDQKYGLHFDTGPYRHNYSESAPYFRPTIARRYDTLQPLPPFEGHPDMSYHDLEGEDLPRIRYNDSLYDSAVSNHQSEIDGYIPPPNALVPDSRPAYPQTQPVAPMEYDHRGVRNPDKEGIHYFSGPKHRNYSEAVPPSQLLPVVHVPVIVSAGEQVSFNPRHPDHHGIRYTDQSGIHFYSGPKHRNYSEALPPFVNQPAIELPVPARGMTVPVPYGAPYPDRRGIRYTNQSGIHYFAGPKHRNYSEAMQPFLTQPAADFPIVGAAEQVSVPYGALYADGHDIRHTNQSGIHYFSGPKHRNYSEALPPFLSQPASDLPVFIQAAGQVPYGPLHSDGHGIRYNNQSGIHYYSGPKHRNYSEALTPFVNRPAADPPVFIPATEQVPAPYGVLYPDGHGIRYTNQSGIHYYSGPKHRNYSEALPPFLLGAIENLPAFVPTVDQGPYDAPVIVQHGSSYTNQPGIRYDSGAKHQNFSEAMPLFQPVPITPLSYIQHELPQPVPETTVKHGVRYTNQSGIHYQQGSKHRNYSEGVPPPLTHQIGNIPVLYNQYEVSQYVQTADGTVKRRRLRFYKNESGENTGLLSENQPYRVDLSDALPAPTHESSTMVAETVQASQSKAEPVLPPAVPTPPAGTGKRRLRFDQPPTPLSLGIRYNTGPNRHNFSETLPEHFAYPVLSKLEQYLQYPSVALSSVLEIPVMQDILPNRAVQQEHVPVNQSSLQQLPYVQTDIPVFGHKAGIRHDNETRAGIHYRRGPYRHDYSEAVRPFEHYYIPTNAAEKIPEQNKPPAKGRRLRYGEFYPKAEEKGIQFDNGTQRFNLSEAVHPVKINVSYPEVGTIYETLPVDVGMTSLPLMWPMKSSRAIRYDNGSSIEEDDVSVMVTVKPYSPAAASLSGWTRGITYDNEPYPQNYSEGESSGFAPPYTVPLHFIPTMYQQRRNATYGQAFFPVTKPYLSKLHFENGTSVDEATTLAPRTTITYGTSRRMRYDDKDGIKYDRRPEDEAEEASTELTMKRTVPPSFIPKVHFNYSSMGNETKEAGYLERKIGIRFDNYSKVEDEADMKASTLIIPLIPSTKHGILKKVRFNGTTGFTKMLIGKRYPSKPFRAASAKRPHRLKYDNTSTAELQRALGKMPSPKVVKPLRFDNETAVEEKDAYTKIPVSAHPLHYNDTSRITTLGMESSQQAPIVIRKFRQNETTADYKTGSAKPRMKYNETRNDMDYQDIPEASRSVYQPRQKLMSIRMRYDNDTSDAIGPDDVQPSGEPIRLMRLTTNVDQTMELPSPTWIFLNGTLPGHLKSVGVPVTFVERPMGPARVLPIRMKENVSEADHDYEEKELMKETYQNVSRPAPSYIVKGISYENETGVDRLKYEEHESTTVKEALAQPSATLPSVSLDSSTLRLRYGEDYGDEDQPYIVEALYPTAPVYAAPLQPPGPTGIDMEDVDIGDDADEDVMLKKYYVPIPEMGPPQPPVASEIAPAQIPLRNNWERSGAQRFKGRYNQSEVDEVQREPVVVKHIEKDHLYAEYATTPTSPVSQTVEISPPSVAVSPVQIDVPSVPVKSLASGWERSASGRSFIRRYNGTSIDDLYTQGTVQLRPSPPSAHMLSPGPVQTGWEKVEQNRAFRDPYNLTDNVPYEVVSPGPPAVSVVPLIPSKAPFTFDKIETNWDTLSFDDYTDLAVLPALSVPVQQEPMEPHYQRPEFAHRYNYSLHDEPDEFRFPVLSPEQPKVYPDISRQSQTGTLGYDFRPINVSIMSQQELPPPYIPTGWERAAPNVAFVERYNVTRQLHNTSRAALARPHIYPPTALDHGQKPIKHRYEGTLEVPFSAELSRVPLLTEQRPLTFHAVPNLRRAPLPSAGHRDEYTDSSRTFKRRFNESLDHHPEVPLEDVMKAAETGKQVTVAEITLLSPQQLSEMKEMKPVDIPPPRVGWERASEQQFSGRYNESVPEPFGYYPPGTRKIVSQVTSPMEPPEGAAVQQTMEPQIPSQRVGWERVSGQGFSGRYNVSAPETQPLVTYAPPPDWQKTRITGPAMPVISQVLVQQLGRTGWERIPDQGFSGRYNVSEREMQPLLTDAPPPDWQKARIMEPEMPVLPQMQVHPLGRTGWGRVPGQGFIGRYNVSEPEMRTLLTHAPLLDWQKASVTGPEMPAIPQTQIQHLGHTGWVRIPDQGFSGRYNVSEPEMQPLLTHAPPPDWQIARTAGPQMPIIPQIQDQQFGRTGWERIPDQGLSSRYNVSEPEMQPFLTPAPPPDWQKPSIMGPKIPVIPPIQFQPTGRIGWERISGQGFSGRYNVSETEMQPLVRNAAVPDWQQASMTRSETPQMATPQLGRTGWERADFDRYFKERYNHTDTEEEHSQVAVAEQPKAPIILPHPVPFRSGSGWERSAAQQFSDRYNETVPQYEFSARPQSFIQPEIKESPRIPLALQRQLVWQRPEGRRYFGSRYNATIDDYLEDTPLASGTARTENEGSAAHTSELILSQAEPPRKVIQQMPSRMGVGWERQYSHSAFDSRYNGTEVESEVDALPSSTPARAAADVSEILQMPPNQLSITGRTGWERADFGRYFKERYNYTEPEPEVPKSAAFQQPISPAEPYQSVLPHVVPGWERTADQQFSDRYNESGPVDEVFIATTPNSLSQPRELPLFTANQGTKWERPDSQRVFASRYNGTIADDMELPVPAYPPVSSQYEHVPDYQAPTRLSSDWERQSAAAFDLRYNESVPEEMETSEPAPAVTEPTVPVYSTRHGISWERPETNRGFMSRYNGTLPDGHEEADSVTHLPSEPKGFEQPASMRVGAGWERPTEQTAFDSRYNESVPEGMEKSEPALPVTEPTMAVYSVRQGMSWERSETNRGFMNRYNGTLPDGHEEADSVPLLPLQPKDFEQAASVRVGAGWERPTEQAAFDSRYNESVPQEETETPNIQTSIGTYAPEKIPYTTAHPQYQGIRWERPDDQRGFVGRYNATIPDHHDERLAAAPAPSQREVPVREKTPEGIRVGSAWERPGLQSFDTRYNETEEQPKKRTGKAPQRTFRLFGPRYDVDPSETEHLEAARPGVTLPSPTPPAGKTMSTASAWRFERIPGTAFSSRFNTSDEAANAKIVPSSSKSSLRYNASTHPKDHDELPVVPLPVAARKQRLPDTMVPAERPVPSPLPTLPTLAVSRYGSLWERPESDRTFKDRFNRTRPSKYKAPGTILSLFDRARPTVYSPQSFGSRFNASIEETPERVAPIRQIINVDTETEIPDWQRKLVFINASIPSGFKRPEITAPLSAEPKVNATQPCLNRTDIKAPQKYTERVAGSNPNLYGIKRDEKLVEMFDESLTDLVFSLRKSKSETARPAVPQPLPTDPMIPVQLEERFQVPLFVNRSFGVPSYPFDSPPTTPPQIPYSTNAMQKYYVPTRIHIPLPTELQPQQNSDRLSQDFFHFANGTDLRATLGPIQTSKLPKRPIKGFKTGMSKPMPLFRPSQSNASQLTANKPRKKFATNASLIRPTPGRTRTPVHSMTGQHGIAAYSYDPNQALPTRKRSKGFKVTKRPTPPDVHYTLGFTVPPYSPPPVIKMQPVMPVMNVNSSWNMPPSNGHWNMQPMMPTMNTTNSNVHYGHYNANAPVINVSHIAIPPQPYFPPSESYFPAHTNLTKAVWSTNQTECCRNITVDAGQVLDIFVNKTNDLNVLDTIKINMSAAPPRNSSVTGYSVKLQLVRAPLVSLASICNAPMVVEPQGIMKEIDCSQKDIGDVVIGVHVRAGSGSFHFDIINKTEATDGNKFIIDETNGYLYPSVPFHEKAPADSLTLLGAGHGYDVLVQVTDTICDVSDHAYVSVMFVCRHDVTTLRTRRPRSYRKQS